MKLKYNTDKICFQICFTFVSSLRKVFSKKSELRERRRLVVGFASINWSFSFPSGTFLEPKIDIFSFRFYFLFYFLSKSTHFEKLNLKEMNYFVDKRCSNFFGYRNEMSNLIATFTLLIDHK